MEWAAGGDRTFRTVNLQKSYLDREGDRQYSGSLSLAELPTALEVLRMALNYVAGEEAFIGGVEANSNEPQRGPRCYASPRSAIPEERSRRAQC